MSDARTFVSADGKYLSAPSISKSDAPSFTSDARTFVSDDCKYLSAESSSNDDARTFTSDESISMLAPTFFMSAEPISVHAAPAIEPIAHELTSPWELITGTGVDKMCQGRVGNSML